MIRVENKRQPKSADDLSAIEREQLRIVGLRFDGRDRTPESRFRDEPISAADEAEGIDWDDGNLGAHQLILWEAHDGEKHLFDLWLHHADSGCAFLHGKTDLVAERCQFDWMKPGLMTASELAVELDEALANATAEIRTIGGAAPAKAKAKPPAKAKAKAKATPKKKPKPKAKATPKKKPKPKAKAKATPKKKPKPKATPKKKPKPKPRRK